ncbi:MAG: RDD family protein [Bdellovibrionales bacterium]|nr:RDD family protein [Bdellovibrionales bacterium]
MTYTNLHTAPTSRRFFIGILNLLTPVALLAITTKFRSPLHLNWVSIFSIVIYLIVNHIVLVKLYGGSLFHILFRLRVIQAGGERGLSWMQAIKRALATNFLSLFTFSLPFATVFLNSERKTLGDIWAKTRVVHIVTARETLAQSPRYLLVSLLILIGLLGTTYQLATYAHTEVSKRGLTMQLPFTASKTADLWSPDMSKQFIDHCTSLSSEYLKVAMQGQNVDDKLMTKFKDSIASLCVCVAKEVEQSSYGSKAKPDAFKSREDFEALFESEDFTIAYVQASATCESSLQ